jgi:hypothetical protein
LTHVLSSQFPVIAIDGDEKQLSHSKKRESFLLTRGEGWRNPVHHVKMFISGRSLVDVLKQCRISKSPDPVVILSPDDPSMKSRSDWQKPRFLLTGLHACGDLSSEAMLKPMVMSEEEVDVVAVVAVGCCYQHLTPVGFPLSKQLRQSIEVPPKAFPFRYRKTSNSKSNRLLLPTYRLLNCACQTVIGFSTDRILETWKAHSYRAMLNAFLERVVGLDVDFDGTEGCEAFRIGNLKADDFRHGFPHYLGVVKGRFKNNYLCFENEDVLDFVEANIDVNRLQGTIAFVSTMRRIFGPCMERLVLCDRLRYLEENGFYDVELINLFEEGISPRNVCLVASKSRQSIW